MIDTLGDEPRSPGLHAGEQDLRPGINRCPVEGVPPSSGPHPEEFSGRILNQFRHHLRGRTRRRQEPVDSDDLRRPLPSDHDPDRDHCSDGTGPPGQRPAGRSGRSGDAHQGNLGRRRPGPSLALRPGPFEATSSTRTRPLAPRRPRSRSSSPSRSRSFWRNSGTRPCWRLSPLPRTTA